MNWEAVMSNIHLWVLGLALVVGLVWGLASKGRSHRTADREPRKQAPPPAWGSTRNPLRGLLGAIGTPLQWVALAVLALLLWKIDFFGETDHWPMTIFVLIMICVPVLVVLFAAKSVGRGTRKILGPRHGAREADRD